jgi:hypothetical protein
MAAVVAVAAVNAANKHTSYSSRGGQQGQPFPSAAECSPESRPLPRYDQCLKVGTVLKHSVTGVWQQRTLFLTKDKLGVAHKDTGFLITEIDLLEIVKIADLRSKVEHGKHDSDEHVLVQDEVDCCFNLYIQAADVTAPSLPSRPTSPASPPSMPRTPDMASGAPVVEKHKIQLISFRAQSEDDRQEWEEVLEQAVTAAKEAQLASRPLPTLQDRIRVAYDGQYSQAAVMTLVSALLARVLRCGADASRRALKRVDGMEMQVMANFFVSIGEAEIVPEPGSEMDARFQFVDSFFTGMCTCVGLFDLGAHLEPVSRRLTKMKFSSSGIFTVELCINIVAHWFWPFVNEKWNWLDVLVVIVSLASVGSDAGPTVKVIRILRALRVMRLVKRLIALRMIVAAIWASIIPVLNVFFVLMIATLVYSILGVGLFREAAPEFFGNLSRSFFTMFQCVTGM